jgi:hypothetical protein
MSAQIIPLVSEDAVNTSWEEYANTACRLILDPTLIADRAFNEELARKHSKWVRLFLRQEAVGQIAPPDIANVGMP